jgi:hypothetical protein
VDAPDLAGLIASPERRISFSFARAKEQIVESLMAGRSPGWHQNHRGSCGKPRFNDINAHLFELPGNPNFLFLGHGSTRALLTVA